MLVSNISFAKGSNFLQKKVTENLPKQTLSKKTEKKRKKSRGTKERQIERELETMTVFGVPFEEPCLLPWL